MLPRLPITDILDSLKQCLTQQNHAIVLAPPGAGKTSVIPLSLLAAAWLKNQKIVLLQPRRLAVKSIAARLAQLLGEPIGQRVGFRVRHEVKVSSLTQIEVMTEGVFLRLLHNDPSLDGIGVVIFDECHERHLDTDLSLALLLNGQGLFADLRAEPLKVLMMSATLDGSGLSALLEMVSGQSIPVLESHGRSYPVDVRYHGLDVPIGIGEYLRQIDRIIGPIVDLALHQTDGSLLVFLPGMGEITRLQKYLGNVLPLHVGESKLRIMPLYGGLSLQEQRRVVSPPEHGVRHIILSTSIAQTSVTIEGIGAVIDSGLVRVPKYDSRTGLTRLVTERVSQATATQRSGRAGRMGPGVAYRVWPESIQTRLRRRESPEILSADLTAFLLHLYQWGTQDPNELHWLDTPPPTALAAAHSLLHTLGAISDQGQGIAVTSLGEQLSRLPVSPRLGRMLLAAFDAPSLQMAAELAAMIGVKDPLRDSGTVDISKRLALLSNRSHGHYHADVEQLVRSAKRCLTTDSAVQLSDSDLMGYLLAHAYPDRLAKRGSGTHYTLANGRGVSLEPSDPLAQCPWLVVADVGGAGGRSRDRVFLATAFNPELLIQDGPLAHLCSEQDQIVWNSAGRLVAQRNKRLGEILVSSQELDKVTPDQRQQAVVEAIRQQGLGLLQVNDAVVQWRARVAIMAELFPEEQWPDVSDQGLTDSVEYWLGPKLANITKMADLSGLDLLNLLGGLLDWSQTTRLQQRMPSHLKVPSGLTVPIDYGQSPPVLAVKLQAMFGLDQTPVLAEGRLPLSIHLLSPAARPIQITQDLAGFWRGSYQEVRKELKGRYPKHPWPEDPATCVATHRPKPRRQKG